MGRGGDHRRLCESGTKPFRVSNRPVGVDAHHDRGRPTGAFDLCGSPGQRGRRSRRARLGHEIRARDFRREPVNRLDERRVGQHKCVLRVGERCHAIERVAQQGAITGERQQLLRSLRRAERPESRPHATGQNHAPDFTSGLWPLASGLAHTLSGGRSTGTPASSAVRWSSRFGLKGFVMKSVAPSVMARSRCVS